jgi:hypothetical protein
MKSILVLLSSVFIFLILPSVFIFLILPSATAEVFIPEGEFHGYFDSNGIYTIIGAVRNSEKYPVLPTITIEIKENGKTISLSQKLPTVFPNKDIPFKLKIPEVVNQNIILGEPHVVYVKDEKIQSNVEIIYDKTLVKHKDGHLTGRIINQGNDTEYDVKVYATIHGENHKFLDVGQNIEKITQIHSGQILNFSMYPEPELGSQINYYSCFAIGDETIIPLSAIRDGEKFKFRYDSTASFTVLGFDQTGTKLSLNGINSFKVPTYVNFEFPKMSEDEKFAVNVNGEPTKFIQSRDEQENWHVAFDVGPSSQSKIIISGFQKPKSEVISAEPVLIPTKQPDYGLWYYVVPLAAIVIGTAIIYWHKTKRKIVS